MQVQVKVDGPKGGAWRREGGIDLIPILSSKQAFVPTQQQAKQQQHQTKPKPTATKPANRNLSLKRNQ